MGWPLYQLHAPNFSGLANDHIHNNRPLNACLPGERRISGIDSDEQQLLYGFERGLKGRGRPILGECPRGVRRGEALKEFDAESDA